MSDNTSNGVIAFLAASPSYLFAAVTQSTESAIMAFGLPIIFFVLGKMIDVAVKIYLARRGKSEQ